MPMFKSSGLCVFKVLINEHIDQKLSGNAEALSFLVQRANHPARKIHIDALLLRLAYALRGRATYSTKERGHIVHDFINVLCIIAANINAHLD